MRGIRWLVVSGLAVVLAVAAGCAAHSSDESSSSPAVQQSDALSAAGAPTVGAAEASSVDDGVSFAVDAASAPAGEVGRSVVSTATMTLRADDIAATKARATAAVAAAGGYLYAEQGQYGDRPSVTVTMKVPPDRFHTVLAQLADLGTVDSQQIATDDVTDQVIDLDSRIATAQASVDRVRGFLDRAATVAEISSFENELLRRETDLEKLRGQKRALDSRVDLATVVLTVQPPVVAPVEPPADRAGFVDGLAAGWHAFTGAVTVVLVLLGAVLPFVPLVFAGAAFALWWRRRSRPVQPTT